ncbi:MAG: hypothetical protein ABI467_18300 [Kofleriaceae bacterium]
MMLTKMFALALALALAACQRHDQPAAHTGSAGSAGSAVIIVTKTELTYQGSGSASASKDPWVPTDASTVPETAEAKKHRADIALGRVASIMPKLAALRELTFDHDIPRMYQSTEDFRTFVHTEITKDLPKDKAADESAALYHIGLLTKPGNLAELEEQAFTTQAGAYYDPVAKKFFLVMVPDSDLMLDTISAHELTHGLQDQHFDLQKFMPSGDQLDDDHQAVRRFVAEGDATFTMFLYSIAQMSGGKITPKMIAMLRAQLATFATMSPEDMIKQNAAGFGASLDPEIKKSVDAMGEIPMTVLVPMIDSYMQGALMVAAAYDRGGWKAVDALYTNPPESTEQGLHPATKLFPTRDHPKAVTFSVAAARSEAEISNVVLGELQWQIYFQLWLPAQKAIASEGWGGDRVKVTKNAAGKLTAWIATVWDTRKDADEFKAAYVASLAKRFPKGSGDPASATGFDRGDDAGKIYLNQNGLEVVAVDGAEANAKAVGELAAATKIR